MTARKPRLCPVVDITDLPTLCWCETEILIVPAAVVRAGRTLSCGRRGCSE